MEIATSFICPKRKQLRGFNDEEFIRRKLQKSCIGDIGRKGEMLEGGCRKYRVRSGNLKIFGGIQQFRFTDMAGDNGWDELFF